MESKLLWKIYFLKTFGIIGTQSTNELLLLLFIGYIWYKFASAHHLPFVADVFCNGIKLKVFVLCLVTLWWNKCNRSMFVAVFNLLFARKIMLRLMRIIIVITIVLPNIIKFFIIFHFVLLSTHRLCFKIVDFEGTPMNHFFKTVDVSNIILPFLIWSLFMNYICVA